MENYALTLNGDSTSNYTGHRLQSQGRGADLNNSSDGGGTRFGLLWGLGSAINSNMYGTGIVDILEYTNTNKNKATRIITGATSNNYDQYSQILNLDGGSWMSTSAVTSITIFNSNGYTFSGNSHFALYGIL